MKKLLTTLLFACVIAFSYHASAATVQYVLTESNDLADGVDYAVVTIADELDGNLDPTGNISFTVDILDALVAGTNFGLQAFSFNYDMTVLGSDPEVTLDSSGLLITNVDPVEWTVTNTKGSISEFGKFDFDLAGDGSSRADPLTFLITGVEGDTIDNYSVYFAAHIAGFELTECDSGGDDGLGCTSAWVACAGHADRQLTPPVPIPAAAWLFGSGLIGLVGIGRRKA